MVRTMLTVRFKGATESAADLRVGPAPAFLLDGPTLRAGDETIAAQEKGAWKHDGTTFPAVETTAPTQVRFEDERGFAVTLGPFDRVQLSGSGIRCGHGFGEILASFNERSQCWYEYLSRKRYATVVLEAADGRGEVSGP